MMPEAGHCSGAEAGLRYMLPTAPDTMCCRKHEKGKINMQRL